jgi:hypothetical protein
MRQARETTSFRIVLNVFPNAYHAVRRFPIDRGVTIEADVPIVAYHRITLVVDDVWRLGKPPSPWNEPDR